MQNIASIRVQKQSVSIVYMVSIAALFVRVSWLLQTTTFVGDAKNATVLWTLLAAAMAGMATALMYVARYWLKAE